MNTTTPAHTETGLQSRDRIVRATVTLLNEGDLAATTLEAIAASADVSEGELAEHFATVNEIFAEIVQSLHEAHTIGIDSTILRRRSLTESLQVAMLAFWTLVESRIEDHQATQFLQIAQLTDPTLIPGLTASMHETHLRNTERWLAEIERIHGIRWELPVATLSQLTLATMDGLILGYLANRNGTDVRRVLDIFAFQLAQHGRRVAKNYPY